MRVGDTNWKRITLELTTYYIQVGIMEITFTSLYQIESEYAGVLCE